MSTHKMTDYIVAFLAGAGAGFATYKTLTFIEKKMMAYVVKKETERALAQLENDTTDDNEIDMYEEDEDVELVEETEQEPKPVYKSPKETLIEKELEENVFKQHQSNQVMTHDEYIQYLIDDIREEREEIDDSNLWYKMETVVEDDIEQDVYEPLKKLSVFMVHQLMLQEELKEIYQYRLFNDVVIVEDPKAVSMAELILYFANRYHDDLEDASMVSFINNCLAVTGLWKDMSDEIKAGVCKSAMLGDVNNSLDEVSYGLFGTEVHNEANSPYIFEQYQQYITEAVQRFSKPEWINNTEEEFDVEDL